MLIHDDLLRGVCGGKLSDPGAPFGNTQAENIGRIYRRDPNDQLVPQWLRPPPTPTAPQKELPNPKDPWVGGSGLFGGLLQNGNSGTSGIGGSGFNLGNMLGVGV
jgi:hypothetical protein